MKKYIVILAALLIVTPSFGQISMRIVASAAPNSDAPTEAWPNYRDAGLRHMAEGGFIGDRGSNPAAFTLLSNDVIHLDDMTVSTTSGVKLWRGNFSPGEAFAGEMGGRLHFFLEVESTNSFLPGYITWQISSSDPANIFIHSGSYSGLEYSLSRRGVSYGADGRPNTFDDVPALTGSLNSVGANIYRTSGRGVGFVANSAAEFEEIRTYVRTHRPTVTITYRVHNANGTLLASASKTVRIVADAGEIPTAANLSIRKNGRQVMVTVGGNSQTQYQLQTSGNLRNWSTLGTFSGGSVVTNSILTHQMLFYRALATVQ